MQKNKMKKEKKEKNKRLNKNCKFDDTHRFKYAK
jgi:hypothetical protein